MERENAAIVGNQSQQNAAPERDLSKHVHSNCDFVSKLARVEAKVRDLEKKYRRDSTKAETSYEYAKQLDSKISVVREQILEYKETQSRDLQDRYFSLNAEKLLSAHPIRKSEADRDALSADSRVVELIADNMRIKEKMKFVSANATRACRSLSGGLSDVQQATVELLSWTDQVHTAFGIMSEKLFLMKNICPCLRSSFLIREKSSHSPDFDI